MFINNNCCLVVLRRLLLAIFLMAAAEPMASADLKHLADDYLRQAQQYYRQGDYKHAYEYHVKYKQLNDSVNKDIIKTYQTAQEKAEQALRENDSLMANNKELQMSEYSSLVESLEAQERARQLKWTAAGLLAAVAFVFIAVYANIRRLQLRRLKEAYDKLEEATAAKERIESELRIARDIQMSMIPHEFPKSERLDFFASMTPAKEVGGDLYDYLIMGDMLYFCLGDVSGKGVPAALFMAESARLFRTLCKYNLSPSEIATSMNNELALNNESGMFVTMFLGLLDLKTGRLDFCNAGHNPPVLDGSFIKVKSNAPLGLWENLEFDGECIEDISGKQLFVYSDGLNEAENASQDQYSDDRLLAILQKHTNLEAHQLIDLVTQDVEIHVNGAAPSDDLTMLCIRKK